MWTDQAQLQDMPVPRALGTAEVQTVVRQHARAAALALDAGFDGVELHGANGYLLEQFLNPASNQRTDRYGGRVEHRARVVIEVVRAVAEVVGPARTGVRLSPFSTVNDQPPYAEIARTYAHLAEALQRLDLAYLHLVDPTRPDSTPEIVATVATMRRLFTNPVILNGGYDALPRIEAALGSGRAQLIAVGRPYVANPDFVARLRDQRALTPGDPATYYAPGPNGFADGYTTYSAATEAVGQLA
jgi:N-ethylmaleimide reductase